MVEIVKKFSNDQFQQLDSLIERYGKKPDGLIPLLEKAQNPLSFP